MHSSPFRLIVFSAFISIFHLHAGLEDFTILVSPDGKQYVILAGDNHELHPENQTENLAAAIAECQKKDPSEMAIYVETPATLFSKNYTLPHILTDLEPRLQKLKVPGISAKNCEIRNVSGLAIWLFNKKYPDIADPEALFECGGRRCIVGQATFDDLDREFHELHQELINYAQTQTDFLRRGLESNLYVATRYLEAFKINLEKHDLSSKNILEAALTVAIKDLRNPEQRIKSTIGHMVFEAFSRLFNMNLVRNIFSSQQRKQLILSGLLHTRAVRDFLINCNWKISGNRACTDQLDRRPEFIDFSALTQIANAPEE